MIFLDEFDSYIVVSFMNATLVLSIGETVEEVTESGFLGTTPTLACSQLGEDALIQVGVWSVSPKKALLCVCIIDFFFNPFSKGLS